MSEKEVFLKIWKAEYPTTLKVIKAYPNSQLDLKTHERSRAAGDLIWTILTEEYAFVTGVMAGKIDFSSLPKKPATLEAMITWYENIHPEMIAEVESLSEKDFSKTLQFFTGPKQMADVTYASILWMMLLDQIHHRGQLSVSIRLAGGKVPAIYGPSADETWQ